MYEFFKLKYSSLYYQEHHFHYAQVKMSGWFIAVVAVYGYSKSLLRIKTFLKVQYLA